MVKLYKSKRVVSHIVTLSGLASGLRRLLPTLHISIRIAATGCSKALRGLRFQIEGTGLCTSNISFTGFQAGTVGVSLGLHASRQLSGKVLRYLKRVIVTPAVYRSFAPLKRSLRYRHWAGFSGNTHPSGLAATYVFIKQSGPPCHCDQSFSWLAPLIPKVQG